MSDSTLPEDFGVDLGGAYSIEGALEWADEHGVRYVDVRLTDRLDPDEYGDDEVDRIKRVCDEHDISLGLHTLSAVNVATFTPYLSAAVDEYYRAYVDIAAKTDADRVIIHAGDHFTVDERRRRETSLQRLEEVVGYAEDNDVTLLLENLNPEPEDAEVHHLCSDIEDIERYFDRLKSPNLGWAFNPPHAHLHEAGIDGFFDALDFDLCRQVRLNDNRGVREEHLMPGEGTIDFEDLFDRFDRIGYDGHYMVALGTGAESLRGVQYLQALR